MTDLSNDPELRALAHDWKTDDGALDIFAAEDLGGPFCNGPKCRLCGYEFCHHCNPDGYADKCPMAAQMKLGEDQAIYGVSYIDKATGKRVDPRDVKPSDG